MSWAEAELGVLACGASPAAATGICLPIVCAALRRRKAVIVADLSGGSQVSRAVRALAAFAGLLAGDLAGVGTRQRAAAFGQVLRQRAEVWQLLQAGAVVYVCGDASRMAPDVRRAFAAIHRHETGGDERAAEVWLDGLTAENRYLVDVWAS